ncbi:hypothetical protein D9756_004456 [Leucocoprinus leucothites]|uniref:Uncharacterized protein n=1 Tax=Leucocoprinus leucothites TaxID=201217 RepID=A0A8H5LKC0_9AGAR|nr:hypothetical protein D9756_004456 [Leucoagaricus leucothites]
MRTAFFKSFPSFNKDKPKLTPLLPPTLTLARIRAYHSCTQCFCNEPFLRGERQDDFGDDSFGGGDFGSSSDVGGDDFDSGDFTGRDDCSSGDDSGDTGLDDFNGGDSGFNDSGDSGFDDSGAAADDTGFDDSGVTSLDNPATVDDSENFDPTAVDMADPTTDTTDGTDVADGSDKTDDSVNTTGDDSTTADNPTATDPAAADHPTATDSATADDPTAADFATTDDATATDSVTADDATATASSSAGGASATGSSAASSTGSNSAPAAGACPPAINFTTVHLIKQFEGFVASPKPDPIGLLTVGFGHKCQKANCAEVPFSFPLSQDTAAQLLQTDATTFTNCVNQFVSPGVQLNDNQFGVLTLFAFDLGCGTLKSLTLLKRLVQYG